MLDTASLLGAARPEMYTSSSSRCERRLRAVAWATRGPSSNGSEDYARQPLLGYLHRGLVDDSDVEVVKLELAAFAYAEGFSMGSLYVEQSRGWPAAFEALIEAVTRYKITAVVLPSLLHLAALGAPTAIRDAFEWSTGARVLVAQPP